MKRSKSSEKFEFLIIFFITHQDHQDISESLHNLDNTLYLYSNLF